jgi:DNA-binding transcriptional LysR family regulator
MISTSNGWDGIELRHLIALQAVAAEGSFGRAAERLGYTQSAVSQQIAALERIVGERLVDRPGGPRRIALTTAGSLLVRHAEAMLARLHAAKADLAALARGEGGSLMVGVYQSVGRRILPALITEFSTAWPAIEIGLHEASIDDELLPLIERGELDISFGVFPLPAGPFEAVEVLIDPYVLVTPADSPLARTRPSLHDIAALPLIGFRQCRSFTQVDAALRSAGVEPRFVFRSDDNGTVQGLVAAGMGVALVPLLTVETSDNRIAVLSLAEEIPPRRLAVIWHRDRYRSPAVRAFIETVQRVCASLDRREIQQPA